MKKMKSFFKQLNFPILYWFSLFVCLLIFIIIGFIPLVLRLWDSVCCFGIDFFNYLKFVFVGEEINEVLGTYSYVSINENMFSSLLPIDARFFFEQLLNIICVGFNETVFIYWWNQAVNVLLIILRILSLLLIVGLSFYFSFKNYFSLHEYQEKTVEKTSIFKKIYCYIEAFFKNIYETVKDIIFDLVEFTKKHSWVFKTFLLLVLFKTKILSLILESIGFLLAFICKFDFLNLWNQLLLIFQELFPYLIAIPLWIYILIVLALLARHWIKASDDELRHLHLILKTIVKNEFTTTNFFVGKPGSGKDLLMTELTIVAESSLRYDLLNDVILPIRKEFPEFPFNSFEKHLQAKRGNKEIVNWAQAENYVLSVANEVIEKEKDLFFNYPWKTKKSFHYDELVNKSIFDAISEYAHAYFMYSSNTVLACSNYAIRFDNLKIDNGHFIIFDDDFVSHDNRYLYDFSSYSHINNYDWERVYKKMEYNEQSSLEEGLINAFSEYAKERGNQNDNRAYKIDDELANPLNDGTNTWWKTKSHVNTIRGKRYGKSFVNDQRDQALNSDNRDTFEYTWEILSRTEYRNVLHGFWYSQMLLDLITSFTDNLVWKLINNRSDDGLISYLIKKINSSCHMILTRIKNRYGFDYIEVKNQYDKKIKVPIIYKLDYADRYNTGAFGSVYKEQLLNNTMSFDESPTYESSLASIDELLSQNSYFINKFIFINQNQERSQTDEDPEDQEENF